MAKKQNQVLTLLTLITSLVAAGIALFGLSLNFISQRTPIVGDTNWNLGEWFETINDLKNYDKIGSWQFARVMLIAIVILLVAMAVLMIVKYVASNPLLKLLILVGAITAFTCSIIFMITVFIGCDALTKDWIPTYFANVGAYLFSIGAMISAVFGVIFATRK